MVTKEKDEELALFLELRRREKEKERSNLIASSPVTLSDAPLGIKGGISLLTQPLPQPPAVPQRRTAAEKFLDSENEKSDYDWLITPPGTPLVPSSEMETQKPAMNARPTALKSRLTNIQEVPAPRTNGPSKPVAIAGSNRRPSSTGVPKSTSRPSTPTSRPTLPSSRPAAPRSSTPTLRPTLSSSTKPTAASGARSSTPTKPTAVSGPRSSTPTRTTSRSSTPTARPSLPTSKATSRSSTPTRRSSTPSSRSSSVTRSAGSVVSSKNPAPPSSRGSSPTVKSRPKKPIEIPGFSHDAPPNLKTSLPERPASATRGRPGGARSSSTTAAAAANGRPRQQSCSPARVRTSTNGTGLVGSKLPVSIKSSRSSQMYDGGDDLNPGLMGTQMVERVVNMRKLAPPKQEDYRASSNSNSAGNLGRSLSKKSLDMALRHMDIRRSINGSLRPLMTNIPASSMYSVRSSGGSTRSRTVSASGSPHATSSSASSSEPSVNNGFFLDGIEAEENEFTSEKGNSSPISQVSSCR